MQLLLQPLRVALHFQHSILYKPQCGELECACERPIKRSDWNGRTQTGARASGVEELLAWCATEPAVLTQCRMGDGITECTKGRRNLRGERSRVCLVLA